MDSAEFRAFYERTAPGLRGYLRRCIGSADSADDLLQETYLRFLRSAPGGMGEPQMRGYLFRIGDSLLADHWRTQSRQQRRDKRFQQEGQPEGGDGNEIRPIEGLSDGMSRAMERLKPKARRLLWLAYVEALSHREIAEVLSLREGSIRVLLFRARKALEKELRRVS